MARGTLDIRAFFADLLGKHATRKLGCLEIAQQRDARACESIATGDRVARCTDLIVCRVVPIHSVDDTMQGAALATGESSPRSDGVRHYAIMADLLSGVASSVDPLAQASAKALRAHHALGRMSASVTVAQFSAAVCEFLAAARTIAHLVEQAADRDASGARRRAFSLWFGKQMAELFAHPIENGLPARPTVYALRLARGSGPPPFDDLPPQPEPVARPRPDDFFFETIDSRPAITLCSEYLERITQLLDETKRARRRFGLT